MSLKKEKQGSKTKMRLTELLNKHNDLKREYQRLNRALAVICRTKGPQIITYEQAAALQEDDRVIVEFNNKSGEYTIKLVEKVDDKLGSGSDEPGLQVGEGDVAGFVPEAEPDPTSGEVQQGDKHDSESDQLSPNSNSE